MKYILVFEGAGASVVALHLGRWWCPLVAGGQGCSCYFADVSKIVLMLLLFGVFPAFPRFTLGAFPLNVALFRVLRAFSRGFSCSVCVCIALVLCVACGAFVCVSG